MNDRAISKQTTITLGLVSGLVVFVVILSFRFGTEFEKAAGERQTLKAEVKAVREAFKLSLVDRWRRSDAATYHDMLDRLNDGVEFLPVPPEAGR